MATAINWQSATDAQLNELDSIGTVHELMGKGGSYSIKERNWLGTKRISVKITKKNGQFIRCTCSNYVTDQLRKGKMDKNDLAGLPVSTMEMQNEDGVMVDTYWITVPQGAEQTIRYEELKPKAYEVSGEFLSDAFLAGV